MAIQVRRGNYANLDKSKLLSGEIVIATDNGYVGIAKAPSDVVQLATKEMLDNSIPQNLSDLSEDSSHRTVTDTEKITWNNKANTSDIPTDISDLTEDSSHRTVSDTEKTTWNGKLSSIPTASADTLGGIKVGNNLSIDANGVMSTTIYPTSLLASYIGENRSFMTHYSGSGYWWGFYVRSNTHFEKISAGGSRYPIKVIGINY